MRVAPPTPKPQTSTGNVITPPLPKKSVNQSVKRKRVQPQVQNLRRSVRLSDRPNKTRAVEAAKKKDDKKRQVGPPFVREAAKKMDDKKKQVGQPLVRHQKPPTILPPRRHIFIGNLESSITLELLESFFRPCGPIRKTIIRCSRGQALNLGMAIPDSIRSPRDRLYASMAFYDFASVTRALLLNRAMLGGTQLVVSTHPADMPEVADIARPPPLNKPAQAPPKTSGWGRLFKSMPPSREDTERDLTDPRNDRIQIFGYSFDKCIS